MFDYIIKSSNQPCAFVYPGGITIGTAEQKSHEKKYPLMMLESGQMTRVRRDNLKKRDN